MITYITDLDSNNYKEFTEKGLVLIDVHASWCGPCKTLSPIIDQLSSDFNNQLNVGKLNVDDNKELVAELGVRNIPTIILLKDGEILEKSAGMTTLEKLTELVNNNL